MSHSAPTILREIIARKWEEVAEHSACSTVSELQRRASEQSGCRGFVAAMQQRVQAGDAAVIA